MKKLILLGIFTPWLCSGILAQERTVSGTVSTPGGNPVPEMNVILEGSPSKTITDIEGNYKVMVPDKGGTLVFSRTGFATQKITVEDQRTINITTSQTVSQEPPEKSFNPTPSWRAQRRTEMTNPNLLFSRGGPKIYSGEYLGAIRLPVGGVGTGAIHMDGTARRVAWQLWRNFTDFELPHSLFAVRVGVDNQQPVVRALQTVSEDPLPAMESLSFRGEYPFGWYYFEDTDLPVEVNMEVFNPQIPLDAKNSAIPCAIYNLTVRNNGSDPVSVSFLATQQNTSGLVETLPPFDYATVDRRIHRRAPGEWAVNGRSSNQYGGNRNRILRTTDATMLHMSGKHSKNSPSYGEMVLTVREPDALATASWSDFAALIKEFTASGKVSGVDKAGPSPEGETLEGALAVPFVLKPGEHRTVSFILTWYFPNIPMIPDKTTPDWKHDGYIYGNWWSNGLDLAKDVLNRIDDLTATTRQFHESLYSSNLPYWFLDRINSQTAILSSATAFWAKDDHFGVWEGCSWTYGSCPGNATHVWGYAQTVPRMFPSLGRRMREQEHAEQTKEGMLPVRLGQRNPFQAFDGQCHSILASYLAHLQTNDGQWLDRQYPKIKESVNYLINGWDDDVDGMLSGPQHGMDSKHGGTTSWMGSMYLAALSAAEHMARIQGDTEAANRYGQILKTGAKNQDEKLFNGEYYIQIPGDEPQKDYLNGCYTDQMLGQWWAHLLDLGWIYPKEHVRSAMSSLFNYNLKTDFYNFNQDPRKFVLEDEPAMVQTTWPAGGRPKPEFTMLHADEVKVGISYPVAALMIFSGMPTEGFAITRANYDRYDGRLRTGLTDHPWSALGHSGNPFGDDCAGKFYVRSLSVWSLLLASQRLTLDGPRGIIGFNPTWKPNNHVSFFTAGKGWGKFFQKRENNLQVNKIEVDWGELHLRQLVFALPSEKEPSKLTLRAAGNVIQSNYGLDDDGRLRIDLTKEVTIKAGQSIDMSVYYK